MSWLGVLGSGLATAAGVMSDNEYLVAGGAGAAQSYANDYEKLTTSLIDEQKQIRLADALMARQQNYKLWERDVLNKEETEYNRGRQEALDKAFLEESGARVETSKGALELDRRRMALDEQASKNQTALLGVQMESARLTLADQKNMQDPEYRKKRMVEEAQIQAEVSKEMKKLGRAANAEELQYQLGEIDKIYKDDPKKAAYLKTAAQLSAIGIDPSKLASGKPLNQEMVQQAYENSFQFALTLPDVSEKINSKSPELAAEGQKQAHKIAQAGVTNLVTTYNRLNGGGFEITPSPEGKTIDPESVAKAVESGARSEEQLLKAAEGDPAATAAIKKGIAIAKERSSALQNPGAPAPKSGGGQAHAATPPTDDAFLNLGGQGTSRFENKKAQGDLRLGTAKQREAELVKRMPGKERREYYDLPLKERERKLDILEQQLIQSQY